MEMGTATRVRFGAICSITLAVVLGTGAHANAAVLYADDFSGNFVGALGANLHGVEPDVRNGTDGADASATWLAQQDTNFRTNGYVHDSPNNDGMAVLPFTPIADRVYTLTGSINPTYSGATNQNWIGIGFAGAYSGTQSGQSFSNRGNGYAWMLARIDRGTGQGATYGGVLVGNAEVYDSPTGAIAAKIVLDTRDDNWTVTWYANATELRSFTYATVGNPGINYVGFSRNGNARGSIDNFELSAVVPEPSAAALFAGVLPLLRRRR